MARTSFPKLTLLAVALAWSVSLPVVVVVAQEQTSLEKMKIGKVDKDQPMLLQADEVIYDNDNNNNKVTARGNVEIYYGNYTLLANQVVYDRGKGTLTAEGNVRIKEPDGAVITADNIVLTDDFADGFVASLQVVGQDDLRISARGASRKEGETTTFEDAWYTPCKPCLDRPEKPPTWRIRASKVIHKKTEQTLEYVNPRFEFFGVPIAYAPYFKHADPSVKRKSGFLLPRGGHSNELGYYYEQPYYWALSPSYDFTFSPLFTEKEGTVLQGFWRQKTRYGGYKIDLAGVIQPDGDIIDEKDGPRGSIKTQGLFAINQYWNYGWDITAQSDDTFRRFYKFDSQLKTDQISQVFLTGLGERNYFSMRGYYFGGLLADDTPRSESIVHPVIDYNYILANPILGGELRYDANVVSLSRDDGADNNHIINEVKWRRQMIDRFGQVYTPFAQARGDLYQVSNVDDPVTGIRSGDANGLARATGAVGAEYRYPFVAHTASIAHVIEPIGQIISRPGTRDQLQFPNEDARSLVFDDTLLFDIDKFSGYDRVEAGTRANIGVRYTAQLYSGSYARAVFGQSYQVSGNNEFFRDSGLYDDQSDYVSGLYFEAVENFGFFGQARFDQDDFSVRRTDIGSWAKLGPVQAAVNYADLDAQPGLGFDDPRQEVSGEGSFSLTQNWALIGKGRYDLANNQAIQDGFGLQYSDDCFLLAVTYEETFIKDRDIEPDEKIQLRFTLKTIGTYTVDADPFSPLGADSAAGN